MLSLGVYAIDSYEAGRIADEADKAGLRSRLYDYREYHSNWEIPDIGIFRTVIDRVEGRDNRRVARQVAKRIKERGGYVFNETAVLSEILDKCEQQSLFQENNLPSVGELKPEQRQFFPMIAKPKSKSLGMGVQLIQDLKQWEKFEKSNDLELFQIQDVMEIGRDYRVLILGRRALGAMERRAAPGKITANYSQGGSVKRAELQETEMKTAMVAAKVMGLEFAGVDLIQDRNGELKLLEVNRCPQFRGFEKATGINVASELVQYSLARVGN